MTNPQDDERRPPTLPELTDSVNHLSYDIVSKLFSSQEGCYVQWSRVSPNLPQATLSDDGRILKVPFTVRMPWIGLVFYFEMQVGLEALKPGFVVGPIVFHLIKWEGNLHA